MPQSKISRTVATASPAATWRHGCGRDSSAGPATTSARIGSAAVGVIARLGKNSIFMRLSSLIVGSVIRHDAPQTVLPPSACGPDLNRDTPGSPGDVDLPADPASGRDTRHMCAGHSGGQAGVTQSERNKDMTHITSAPQTASPAHESRIRTLRWGAPAAIVAAVLSIISVYG